MSAFGRRTAILSKLFRACSSDASKSVAAAHVDGGSGSDRLDRPVRADGGPSRRERTSDDRTERTERIEQSGRTDPAERTRRTDGGTRSDAVTIEFLDRETVRIVGDLEETVLSLCWWDESGYLGTMTEPIGGVDGERTVAASEAFADQTFAYGPVVTGVEGFASPGPSVPGTGDVSASNPELESHVEAVRDEYDGPGDLEEPFPDAESGRRDRT